MRNGRSIPRGTKTASPSGEPSPSTVARNAAGQSPESITVRIIDDDIRWLQFITETLVRAGYEVSGIKGDVILAGEQFIGSVPPRSQFAVFTNSPNDTTTTVKMYRAGARDCLSRDYDGAKLLAVVEKLVYFKELVTA